MKPCRVHITGASGSGTTTLSEEIGRQFGYVPLDADDYFWLPSVPPFTQKRDRSERRQLLLSDLEKHSSTIVTGSVVNWGAEIEQSFDLVIYLWIPGTIRLERLRAREIKRHGEVKQEFLDWAALYDSGDLSVRSRMLHEKWLSALTCPILRLEGDLSVEERVQSFRRYLKGS